MHIALKIKPFRTKITLIIPFKGYRTLRHHTLTYNPAYCGITSVWLTALRFAPDHEFVALVDSAAHEMHAPYEIKNAKQ